MLSSKFHGRAFRIGQSRDMKVFRLITEGTVEEMMYLRQVYKQVCVILCPIRLAVHRNNLNKDSLRII